MFTVFDKTRSGALSFNEFIYGFGTFTHELEEFKVCIARSWWCCGCVLFAVCCVLCAMCCVLCVVCCVLCACVFAGGLTRPRMALQRYNLPPAAYFPLRRAFQRADRDGSGKVSLQREFRQFLGLFDDVSPVRIHSSLC